MELWMYPHCGERIYGSLEVVLILASVHRCKAQFDRGPLGDRARETTCLSCLRSPTGLCAYHASVLMSYSRPIATRFLFSS